MRCLVMPQAPISGAWGSTRFRGHAPSCALTLPRHDGRRRGTIMNTSTLYLIGAAALSLGGVLAAPVAAQSQSDVAKRLERMMAGESALQGKKLESAIRKAEESPLGSQA